jgi:hypothetical protein
MPVTKKAATKPEPKKTIATSAKTTTKSVAAPAAKRAATATTARPKPEAGPAAPAARRPRAPQIDPEKRRNYVEVAAYYIAERRGFSEGDQTRDWLAAEEEIDRLLQENKLSA